mmetsp:Transcript_17842/g.27605  ORF Transcript_17842/g.27605 Transcript_17842/m.27605 type:complete len:259 (-) Transcript_17842:622-1398(-)
MAKEDSGATFGLDLLKLVMEPLEHVSGVNELSEQLPVHLVANVGVQGEDSGFGVANGLAVEADKIGTVVSPVEEAVDLFVVGKEGCPRGPPLVDGLVVSGLLHRDNVLRVGVVVANHGEELGAFQAGGHGGGDVLHDLYVVFEGEGFDVVRNRVSQPEHGVRRNGVVHEIDHVVKGPGRDVTSEVSPLASHFTSILGSTAIRAAAERSTAVVALSRDVVEVSVQVTNKSYLDRLLARRRGVELVYVVVSESLSGLLLQ